MNTDMIMVAVADFYGLSVSKLRGPKRTKDVARPRQVAFALCQNLTSFNLSQIGREFGGRDHSTVLHGIDVAVRNNGADIAAIMASLPIPTVTPIFRSTRAAT